MNTYTTKILIKGFSLVEMAVVLVILGFVLSALLLPLQAQRNQLFQSETENTLALAKKALIGYAQANGRLPCPATATNFQGNTDAGSLGQESPLGGTRASAPVALNCATQSGFLPAATLGLQPADPQGFALDAWNNRIRYAIADDESSILAAPYDDPSTPAVIDIIRTVDASHPACGGDAASDFTTSGNMSAVGLTCLVPNLRVCGTSTAGSCTATTNLINNAVAVIYSTGATGNVTAGGADETENLDNDPVFVSHDIRNNDPNGEFDHIVVWISPFVLYNAMIEAGQLH